MYTICSIQPRRGWWLEHNVISTWHDALKLSLMDIAFGTKFVQKFCKEDSQQRGMEVLTWWAYSALFFSLPSYDGSLSFSRIPSPTLSPSLPLAPRVFIRLPKYSQQMRSSFEFLWQHLQGCIFKNQISRSYPHHWKKNHRKRVLFTSTEVKPRAELNPGWASRSLRARLSKIIDL